MRPLARCGQDQRREPTQRIPRDAAPASTRPLGGVARRRAALPGVAAGSSVRPSSVHHSRAQAARRPPSPDLGRLLDADVPLYGGLDTVKLTGGVLREAERLAADLWGADVCRFSTGGSTHANQVLCLTRRAARGRGAGRAQRPPQRPVRARAGRTAAGLDRGQDRPGHGCSARARYRRSCAPALAAHPEAVALFCTEPSYQGTLSDLPALAAAAHEHGIPVVVDQAWGAHLGFAPGLPRSTPSRPALTPWSPARTRCCPPSARRRSSWPAPSGSMPIDSSGRSRRRTPPARPGAILASIDASRAFLGSPEGRLALEAMIPLVAGARDQLRAAGLLVPGPEDHPPGRFDPAKLVVHFGRRWAQRTRCRAELLDRRSRRRDGRPQHPGRAGRSHRRRHDR